MVLLCDGVDAVMTRRVWCGEESTKCHVHLKVGPVRDDVQLRAGRCLFCVSGS